MSVKLLTDHHLEYLSLKGAAQARQSLHLSKCHIVGNIMSLLNYLDCVDKQNDNLLLSYYIWKIGIE